MDLLQINFQESFLPTFSQGCPQIMLVPTKNTFLYILVTCAMCMLVLGAPRPRFWIERGLELEAWRLGMTGYPLDTSGQKWTEVDRARNVPHCAAGYCRHRSYHCLAPSRLPSSVGRQLKRANLWIQNIVWVCASQFVQTQN